MGAVAYSSIVGMVCLYAIYVGDRMGGDRSILPGIVFFGVYRIMLGD